MCHETFDCMFTIYLQDQDVVDDLKAKVSEQCLESWMWVTVLEVIFL